MRASVRFACPVCECPGHVNVEGLREWQCPRCDHVLQWPAGADLTLSACNVCGNAELYCKKDFPHALGMGLLAAACVAFLVTNYLYRQWLAWAILLGSAVIDGLLYLLVGDVVVCYRCGAQHRRFVSDHKPFELSVAERYRQERIRRQQLQEQKKP